MTQNRVARSAAPPGGVGVRARMPEPPREGRTATTPRPRTPRPVAARPDGARPRPAPPAGRPAAGGGIGRLTGLGVSLVLLVGCLGGALFDLLLVGGPAWALVALYIGACGYTAGRVRPADWFTALVAPPLAFAAAVIVLATLMPDTFGSGVLGLVATVVEVLAGKAKALYFGAALSAVVLLVRRNRTRRA